VAGMPLQPVTRRSVPDEVFDQLVAEVTGGDLAPGENLPSERRLAEVLGVSRPAVREALQRLATAGLVDVRQGGSTTVRDFRRLGGLDLLPRLLVTGGELDLAVARSILEARLHVGPKIAELAAERTGAALEDDLRAAVALLAAETDGVRRQRHALAFWEQVVAGADSITFRLMFNSMRAAYEPVLDALAVVMSAEVDKVEAYDALTDAIAAGDGAMARRRAHDLLAVATTSLTDALDALER
jgi:GntR family transcriptional regulator, transcriptional repressor for pyruvate dehydrogenase complex